MIVLSNVTTIEGTIQTVTLDSSEDLTLDAQGLMLLPALIDPHVHFRTPGSEYKENWETGAKAALYGGITTVFDMPNTIPSTITLERIQEKKQKIKKQLSSINIPLNFGLYLGADKNHFEQIYRCKQEIIGIKVFMGSSTGDLIMDDDSSLHAIFSLAAAHDLLLAVHAEEESVIQERKKQFQNERHPHIHSKIRSVEAAFFATKKAIELAALYKTRLYILHCSTKREIDLIREAKQSGVQVFVETTPHHLFLTQDAYDTLGTRAQMNPPLRTQEDVEALWKAIDEGVIDTIGSDHAPHLLEEKKEPYGKVPSGVPGIETTLPLLLNASLEGKISIKQIVSLMRSRILDIFRYPPNKDWILVDLKRKKKVESCNLKTKCNWSPYEGWTLQGWPVFTILKGKIYDLK